MGPTDLLTCSAGFRAKGSGSRAPIGVTSGEVPVVDTPCWSERQGHHLNCTVCGAKSSKACGEVFRRI